MVATVDICQQGAGDNADLAEETVREFLAAMEICFVASQPVGASSTIYESGDRTHCCVDSSAVTVGHAIARARDSQRPSRFLDMLRSGPNMVVQPSREAALRPGELVLLDTATPDVLPDPSGIPSTSVASPDQSANTALRPHHAAALDHPHSRHPVVNLTHASFWWLVNRLRMADQHRAAARDRASIDLGLCADRHPSRRQRAG